MTGELASVYTLTQRALELMGAQGQGRIVHVSSTVADGPPAPGMAAHGTAKAALNTFARIVAHEARPLGVNVNVVAPGYVRTESSARIPQSSSGGWRRTRPWGGSRSRRTWPGRS